MSDLLLFIQVVMEEKTLRG